MAAPRSYYGGTGLHVVVVALVLLLAYYYYYCRAIRAIANNKILAHAWIVQVCPPSIRRSAATDRPTHRMHASHFACIFSQFYQALVVDGATNGTSGTEREQVQSGVRVSNSLASYFVAT